MAAGAVILIQIEPAGKLVGIRAVCRNSKGVEITSLGVRAECAASVKSAGIEQPIMLRRSAILTILEIIGDFFADAEVQRFIQWLPCAGARKASVGDGRILWIRLIFTCFLGAVIIAAPHIAALIELVYRSISIVSITSGDVCAVCLLYAPLALKLYKIVSIREHRK